MYAKTLVRGAASSCACMLQGMARACAAEQGDDLAALSGPMPDLI